MRKKKKTGRQMLRYASLFNGSSLETQFTSLTKFSFFKLVLYVILTVPTERTASHP